MPKFHFVSNLGFNRRYATKVVWKLIQGLKALESPGYHKQPLRGREPNHVNAELHTKAETPLRRINLLVLPPPRPAVRALARLAKRVDVRISVCIRFCFRRGRRDGFLFHTSRRHLD